MPARVTAALATAVDDLERHAGEVAQDPAFTLLFDELRALVTSGGKRVRPVFCTWGYRAAGGTDLDACVTVGTAIELVHLCALVHDDIIDAAPTRRGRRTSHLRFGDDARDADWSGDPAHFGMSAALLLGDLALVAADEVFRTAGFDAALRDDAFADFTAMRIEVTLGQFLDIVEGARRSTSAQTALEVATLKTARYTVERPLLVGASLAGATEPLRAALRGYAEPVGVAFQLRDDLLGAFGDEAATGKSVGNDFREGKQTYLVATARTLGDDAQRNALDLLIGRPDLDDAGVQAVQELLRDTGAVAACETRIGELVADGLTALDASAGLCADDSAAALRALAEAMAFRDR